MTQVETAIASVTVYPDRARLTRQGSVTLEAGVYLLDVAGLPPQTDPSSLRASARGSAPSRLNSVQARRVFFSEAPAEFVRELENKIESLQDEIAVLEAKTALTRQQRAALEAITTHSDTYALGLASGELSLENQLRLFDSLRERSTALESEAQALGISKRTLERQLKKLQDDLSQLRGARPRQGFTAQVEIEMLQAGSLELSVMYVVFEAGWLPLYDLRLLEGAQPEVLEIGYLAQVSQQTGEAWESVALTLSTARPALTGVVPELDPWYIAPPVVRAAAPAQIKDAPLAMAPTAAPSRRLASYLADSTAEQVFSAEEVLADIGSSAAAVTYRIPGSVGVPSDGQPHKVIIARQPLPVRIDYVSAPRLVQASYRRAKITNDSPYTLLEGAANLFAEDEFIGSTNLELTAPQGEIELYLGIDDRIKVERELKRRDVDKVLIGGKRRVRYAYELKLENLLAQPAVITVHDQIPVARHEEIKVKLDAVEPRPTRQSELNLLDWEVTLAPKEKKTIRFEFTVEHPTSMVVTGLP
jgi:uncharacterized protein (TIGR02231 family)